MGVVIVASVITLFALIRLDDQQSHRRAARVQTAATEIQADEILLASVSNDTHRADQQLPGGTRETDVAQLASRPNTTTVRTVLAR